MINVHLYQSNLFGEAVECGIINELRRKVIKNFKDQKIIIVTNEAQFKKPKRRLKKFNTINWSTIEGEYVDPSIFRVIL